MKIKANSEQEALEIAKKELNLDHENYSITILKKPKKSWISSKMGIYEILPKEEKDSESLTPTTEESSAYVSVQDGKINIYNPLHEQNFPILSTISDHIILTVNNEIIKSKIALNSNDEVSISFNNIEPLANASVTLSEDKMEATLKIIRKNGKNFFLKDMEKTNQGLLEVDWEETLPPKISLEHCLDLLENAHVQQNFIDRDSIHELLSDTNSCSKVVAKGVPFIESQDAKVVYSPALEEVNQKDGVEPIVNIGEILASKTQAAFMGTEGMTVTGQVLKPKNVKDIILEAGEGAYVTEDQTNVISAIKGRPYLKKGIITVVPILFVNGDLSKEMGDINFDGDVLAKGSVLDEITIQATGNIEIAGSTYNSEIFAIGSVNIQGKAIGCKIQAGKDKSKFYLTIPYFEEINANIFEMFQKIKAVDQAQDKLTIIYKYKDLIESNIKNISKISSLMENEDKLKINDLIKHLRNSLLQITLLKEMGFKLLLSIYNELVELLKEINTVSDEAITLTLSYAQGCELNSCGNIVITGKGSYQTDMVAQNEIIYTSPVSVVRGGNLVAGYSITAGIVGTMGEIYTECRVLQEDGTVKGNFYPGTQVYIHNVKQDIVTIRS